jgi:hypothetical protein
MRRFRRSLSPPCPGRVAWCPVTLNQPPALPSAQCPGLRRRGYGHPASPSGLTQVSARRTRSLTAAGPRAPARRSRPSTRSAATPGGEFRRRTGGPGTRRPGKTRTWLRSVRTNTPNHRRYGVDVRKPGTRRSREGLTVLDQPAQRPSQRFCGSESVPGAALSCFHLIEIFKPSTTG